MPCVSGRCPAPLPGFRGRRDYLAASRPAAEDVLRRSSSTRNPGRRHPPEQLREAPSEASPTRLDTRDDAPPRVRPSCLRLVPPNRTGRDAWSRRCDARRAWSGVPGAGSRRPQPGVTSARCERGAPDPQPSAGPRLVRLNDQICVEVGDVLGLDDGEHAQRLGRATCDPRRRGLLGQIFGHVAAYRHPNGGASVPRNRRSASMSLLWIVLIVVLVLVVVGALGRGRF
jgi:hypothetical protein